VRLFILFLLFITTLLGDTKNVFILHSYSQEYPWTKHQHDAFISKLKEDPNLALHVSSEHLDTKRVAFNEEYQDFFARYLKKKYHNYKADLIYATDDNALNFLLRFKDEIFGASPVVFSGVNNMSLKQQLEERPYRGAFEYKEVAPNLKLIEHFSRQAKHIYFVGDNSKTYEMITKKIDLTMKNFPEFSFEYIASESIDTVLSDLKELPESFVILTTIGSFKDAAGNTLNLEQSIEQLTRLDHLNILSMEDAYFYNGVLGGFVTSGIKHGEDAAKKGMRVLHDEPIDTIAFTTEGLNIYMFDEKSVKAKGFVLSGYVTRDAIILNRTESFFQSHQAIILNLLFLLIVAVMIFIVLTLQMRKKLAAHTLNAKSSEDR
jgi:hypothetical protein